MDEADAAEVERELAALQLPPDEEGASELGPPRTKKGRFALRHDSMQTMARTATALKDSVWLRSEDEFKEIVSGGEQIEALVLHLRAAKKHFDERTGQQAEQDVLQRLLHVSACCHPASRLAQRSSELHARLVDLLKPGHEASTQSSVRTTWDLLQTTLLISSLVAIPVRLAHGPTDAWDTFAKVELCVDVTLALDILISACTPYHTREAGLVISPAQLLRHYALSRFVPDALLAFPLGTALLATRASGMLPLLRLLQCLRVLKAIAKARSVGRSATAKKWLSAFSTVGLTMLYLVLGLVLAWHWMGCIWWYIINHDGTAWRGFHVGLWCLEAPQTDAASLSGTWTAYLVSLHWAAAVTTCIGTPPLAVCSAWQSAWEALTCVCGVVMQSAFFGACRPLSSDAARARHALCGHAMHPGSRHAARW